MDSFLVIIRIRPDWWFSILRRDLGAVTVLAAVFGIFVLDAGAVWAQSLQQLQDMSIEQHYEFGSTSADLQTGAIAVEMARSFDADLVRRF